MKQARASLVRTAGIAAAVGVAAAVLAVPTAAEGNGNYKQSPLVSLID